MNKAYVLLFLLIASCRSLDVIDALKVSNNNNSNKLPTLVTLSDDNMTMKNEKGIRTSKLRNEQYALMSKEFNSLFIRELENNITYPYGEPKGYIRAEIITNDLNNNFFTIIPSAFSLGILNLLGMPFNHPKYSLNFEFSLYNTKKELIKKYTIYASGSAWSAAYYGYNEINAEKKASYNGFKDALNQLKQELQTDHKYLISKLK